MIRTAYFTPSHMPSMNVRVGDFVSRLCFGDAGGFEKFSTMGVFQGNDLIAGIVYHNWHPESGVIEMSTGAISRRWMQGHVIRDVFAFAFDMMQAQMTVIRVSERNQNMVNIANRLGFTGVLIPRLRGRDEAEWLFTMTDDAWRESPVAKRAKIV